MSIITPTSDFWGSFTGYLSGSEWISNRVCWCLKHFTALRNLIWQRTANWSSRLTSLVAVFDSQLTFDRPDKFMSWRSFLCCRRSETLEQFANTSAAAECKCWTNSTGTKDASVCGCMTAAPNDCSFFLRRIEISLLTYLLTYLDSANIRQDWPYPPPHTFIVEKRIIGLYVSHVWIQILSARLR